MFGLKSSDMEFNALHLTTESVSMASLQPSDESISTPGQSSVQAVVPGNKLVTDINSAAVSQQSVDLREINKTFLSGRLTNSQRDGTPLEGSVTDIQFLLDNKDLVLKTLERLSDDSSKHKSANNDGGVRAAGSKKDSDSSYRQVT